MRKGGGRVTDGEKRYQILRGRLYERLPVLALALGLLDWRKAEKTGTDGQFFYAPLPFLEQSTANRGPCGADLLHSVLHAMLGHPWEKRTGRRKMEPCLRHGGGVSGLPDAGVDASG